MRELLGGKGANLAEMASIGLPVPPGFTISTEVCTYFYKHDRKYPKTLAIDVKKAIASVESRLNKNFGASKNPLLVSVRSGTRDSMPGMMDTILNLGLNDETVEGLTEVSKLPFRVGLLSAFHTNVWRCCHGSTGTKRGRRRSVSSGA